MSCRSNSRNTGGSFNQAPRRNNDGNDERRSSLLPPPPIRPTVHLDNYPSVIHAALAVVDGTARTRTEGNDGEDEGDNTRNNQGNQPDREQRQ
jgi:hypothetical protein